MDFNRSEQLAAFGLILTEVDNICISKYIQILDSLPSNLSGKDLREALIERGGVKIQTGSLDGALSQISRWADQGVFAVGVGDSIYPELLREIPEPPPVLFYQGPLRRDLFNQPHLAIVGSRKARPEVSLLTKGIAREIADCGATVISGLAIGADASAHYGALESSNTFPTVAVLGNGLPDIYPRSHKRLAADILQAGGTLLSQFKPGTPPYRSNFLDRNRVISGLSVGVLVVQAAARSGALSTARHALEQGREVLVTPGSATDPGFEGSNRFIQSGAHLVLNISDIHAILPELKKKKVQEKQLEQNLSTDHLAVLREFETVSILSSEILSEKFSESTMILFELEEQNFVQRIPGNQLMITLEGRKVISESGNLPSE